MAPALPPLGGPRRRPHEHLIGRRRRERREDGLVRVSDLILAVVGVALLGALGLGAVAALMP